MEAATASRREQWTFAQWAVVIVASLQLLWALAGLIAEPSIDFGDDAVTQTGARGRLQRRPRALRLPPLPARLLLRDAAEVGASTTRSTSPSPSGATGIWALFDKQPAYVFTFPNNHADAYFHLATGTLFALDRRRPVASIAAGD